MGLGIILGAMSGGANAMGQAIKEDQDAQDQSDLMEQRAELEEQAREKFAQFANNLQNAPLNRAGQALKTAMTTPQQVVAPPITQLSGNDPANVPDPSNPLPWQDGKGLDPSKTPELIQRIKALPDSDPNKAEMLSQLQRQAASDQQAAQDAVAGQTKMPTFQEGMQAAMQNLAEDGDTEGLAAMQNIATSGLTQVPRGGTVIDRLTGKPVFSNPIDKSDSQTALAANVNFLVDNGIAKDRSEAFHMLHTGPASEQTGDPDTNQAIAAMIANGEVNAATVMGRLPSAQKLTILKMVGDINPNWKQQDYNKQQKADNDFSTGPQGKAVNSFNVSIAHIDQLSKLADALDNKNPQLINVIGNKIATMTGQPAPTDFNAAKHIVAAELVKAITGSAGALGDREGLDKTLSDANSPAQLKGVLDSYKGLMIGQLHGLQQQYQVNTGRSDFFKKLSPEAQTLSGITGPVASTSTVDSAPNPFTPPVSTPKILTYDPKTGSFH